MPTPRAKQIRLANQQGRGKADLWQSEAKKEKIAKLLAECEKLENKKRQYGKDGDQAGIRRADEKISLLQQTIRNIDR